MTTLTDIETALNGHRSTAMRIHHCLMKIRVPFFMTIGIGAALWVLGMAYPTIEMVCQLLDLVLIGYVLLIHVICYKIFDLTKASPSLLDCVSRYHWQSEARNALIELYERHGAVSLNQIKGAIIDERYYLDKVERANADAQVLNERRSHSFIQHLKGAGTT